MSEARESFEAKIREYVGVKEGPPDTGPDR